MKMIYPNYKQLYDTGPTETLANFPVEHLLDSHTLKKWKANVAAYDVNVAGSGSVSVNMKVGGSPDGNVTFNAIALFGLEADSVQVEVYADEAMTTSLETTIKKTLNPTDAFGPKQISQVWFGLTERTGEFFFKVTLFNDDASGVKDLAMGMVSIGKAVPFKNPTWGAKADLVNHSLVKALKNGSNFKRKKPISKKVSCTLELPTSQAGITEYQTLIALYERSNSEDIACLWAEGLSDAAGNSIDDDHLIWGSFGTDFQPVRGKYSLSTIQFSLTEGV